MSELISGKEALISLANGEEVQGNIGFEWVDISIDQKLSIKSFTTETNDLGGAVKFRLKPRTTTLNGVEVEQLYSSQWCKEKPDEVTLKFKNKNAAMFFQSKALEIFNGIK